jgi:hypothetical protein
VHRHEGDPPAIEELVILLEIGGNVAENNILIVPSLEAQLFVDDLPRPLGDHLGFGPHIIEFETRVGDTFRNRTKEISFNRFTISVE